MAVRPKLLILDDEQDFLEICELLLAGLPSRPEVMTANSGSRALALLESESFSLLLTDLRMPNMDGFQVLAIVRRRFPSLRIVVMSGSVDDQFRSRAYAMGIDLFVEKPKSKKETELFFDCIESMLESEVRQSGFRGVVQHKALADIIQMECLTQNSAVLKITSGQAVGLIWLKTGDIVDASTGEVKGENAVKEILSWKVGSFELLPAEPGRTRTIFCSAQGLLLDVAQSLDEAAADAPAVDPETPGQPLPKLSLIARTKGVEFLLTLDPKGAIEHWSCDDSEGVSGWASRLLQELSALGDDLKAGSPDQIEGYGPQQHVTMAIRHGVTFVVGLDRTLSPDQVSIVFNQVLSKWAS